MAYDNTLYISFPHTLTDVSVVLQLVSAMQIGRICIKLNASENNKHLCIQGIQMYVRPINIRCLVAVQNWPERTRVSSTDPKLSQTRPRLAGFPYY